MKVSILTQPLGRNYGGLLQAYALQCCLKKLGCDVVTLNRPKALPLKLRATSWIKLFIKKLLAVLGMKKFRQTNSNPYLKLEKFRDRFVSISPLIDSDRKLLYYYSKNFFDALIVGSDQVWRPRYSPKLTNYFFDFCDDLNLNSKRIAYAASFGVDYKEFSEEEVEVCRHLARKFDAISVREASGVNLVKDYFDMPSELVFDPTLLLDCADYECVIERDRSEGLDYHGGLLAYVLDMDDKKEEFVSEVSGTISDAPFYLLNKPFSAPGQDSVHADCYPSVGDWLNSFRLAKFVVTDSFHGCVFSIIFNKPFLVIGNKSRGLARFNSLLKNFGLERRLVENVDKFDQSLALETIDWEQVNKLKRCGREKSIEFLRGSLSL